MLRRVWGPELSNIINLDIHITCCIYSILLRSSMGSERIPGREEMVDVVREVCCNYQSKAANP